MFHASDNFELEPLLGFQVFGLGGYCESLDPSCPCWDRFVDCLGCRDVIKDSHGLGVFNLEIYFDRIHVRRLLLFVKDRCLANAIEMNAEVIFQVFVDDAVQGTDLNFVWLARNGIDFCV